MCRHESKCIKDIVDTISHRLHPITSSVDDNLVGVEARMQDLISKLDIGFGGKRMIGIWGVGGGGKTTLASSVYDEISSKFDGCCFLKNIREESSSKNGLERLQEKIIYGVLKQNHVHLGRVEEGRRMIKDRLCHRMVLIVLDDVDKVEHLEELAGSHDWFGEGSHIIITTRDEHVLTAHKVDVIHSISLLNNDDAMKLFYKHAPQGHRRIEDYVHLSKAAVSYAGGLPLALRVLGRFLSDKEMNEWRSALARLKEIPDANILEKLRISFDGLTPLERELFLDIACFFRGFCWFRKEDIISILDACGFHPVIGIKVLVQKALITVSEDGRFDMHDLVQELAHDIVKGEHRKNPEKHSRVWKMDEVRQICAMDATTNFDKIEAMIVDCPRSDESERVLRVAANMKKLRWIDLKPESRAEVYEPPFPECFPPRELSCLTLRGLNAKQFWEGNKFLPNLRMIYLELLCNLIKTPDFDGLPNLERFMVYDCPRLEEIHPSFGSLEKLVWVKIEECYDLKMLPPITRSKELETLLLPGFNSFYKLLKIPRNMENFLPHNISLWFYGGCLRKLDLSGCNMGDGDIRSSAVWVLPNLQKLNLEGNRFVRLDFSLMQLPRIQYLNISHCDNLVELSELPSSIAVVIANRCRSLETLGDISNCKWLWKVSLLGENKLGQLGGDILLHTMLQGDSRDYFISMRLSNSDIWRGVVPWVDWVKTLTMPLPHDWYNDYSGLLMFVKCNKYRQQAFDIVIRQGVQENFQCEPGQESNEALNTSDLITYVGYVSFSSLRHTGCLKLTYNLISFSLHDKTEWIRADCRLRAVLVPKHDLTQTTKVATDCSEFWEDEVYGRKTFTVQHDSNSSIKILWKPLSLGDSYRHLIDSLL